MATKLVTLLRGAAREIAVACGCALLVSCAPAAPPPLPAARVEVDTDLPVPLMSRLRVDVFGEDGTWIDSRDYSRPDPRDWPTSFGVYADDDGKSHRVWVRMRVYPEGGRYRYQGERFRTWATPFSSADTTSEPRLLKDGEDVTPEAAPAPLMTIDRLIALRLEPQRTGTVRVMLHGACIGTMAKLGDSGRPRLGESESCVDAEKSSQVVVEESAGASASSGGSAQGTWSRASCPTDLAPDDARVCVPGGGTVLGSRGDLSGRFDADGSARSPIVRTFGMRTFTIDRFEVSVRRFREAIARGHAGAPPAEGARCTFSKTSGTRENFPLNCIEWYAARDFCRFEGGDLPTEAQWEHAATVAGLREKSRFPWGGEPPDCEQAVFQRSDSSDRSTTLCKALGVGPAPSGAGTGDVSALGVHDLYGSMSEWTRDTFAKYDSACWANAELVDPQCQEARSSIRSVRGLAWSTPIGSVDERYNVTASNQSTSIGFRCVYVVSP